MKRVLIASLILSLFFSSFFPVDASAAPAGSPGEIMSDYAVLMDASTGQVLYSKDMNKRVFPASTTKILTALLVVENTRPYEVMTVSETAVENITWDNSHIWLAPGERLTVEQGLYALMLPSANDAANVLAEHVAGSTEEFARMMTERAHAIGAVNSNFTNPHGYHDLRHYTTAYDLALITRYAMHNEEFRRYFGTPRYDMSATNLNTERYFTNHQYMLVPETIYYNPDVIGGKVGYTDEARSTMSTVARRDGRTLVCVVMHCAVGSRKFSDTQNLLNFGFEEFSPISLTYDQYGSLTVPLMEDGEEIGDVFFRTEQDFSAMIHDSADISDITVRYSAPDFYLSGDKISCAVSFEIEDTPDFVPSLLGSIVMDHEVVIPTVYTMAMPAYQAPAEEPKSNRTVGIAVLAGAGLFAVVFMSVIIYRRRQALKRRQQRRQRLERVRREAALYNSAAYRQQPSAPRPPPSIARRPAVIRVEGGGEVPSGGGRYSQNVYEFPQRKAR